MAKIDPVAVLAEDAEGALVELRSRHPPGAPLAFVEGHLVDAMDAAPVRVLIAVGPGQVIGADDHGDRERRVFAPRLRELRLWIGIGPQAQERAVLDPLSRRPR